MILVAGVSHKSCALPVRERLAAVPAADALARLREAGWPEAVLLSTCNRFEVYARAEDADAAGRLRAFVEGLAGEALEAGLYVRAGSAAVHHLLAVASGLDSLVVGEAEILGQVKQAYEVSRAAAMTGKLTNVLFQRALYVGKLVRSETAITLGHTSVASVAVDLAERIFGSLRDSSVLLLGAGAMAELTARHLASSKIARLAVANRTWERGRELAERFRGEAVRWEDFPSRLAAADIVISSTGADRPVVTRGLVEAAAASRRGRSLFLIDIAMPRDVEEAVNELEHVYLYSLQDLEGIVAENLSRRRGELEAAQALVRSKADEFASWADGVAAGAEFSLKHSETPRPRTVADPP